VGLTAETPFASLEDFTEFTGRYREAGIGEFVICWLPEEFRGQGFYRDMDERFATSDMLERVAQEVLASRGPEPG
jgi:hypothetical protein